MRIERLVDHVVVDRKTGGMATVRVIVEIEGDAALTAEGASAIARDATKEADVLVRRLADYLYTEGVVDVERRTRPRDATSGPVHCPLCASERGVPIPTECPHR